MGGTFDSINRIGIRYERALKAIAAIDQSYLAAQSYNLAKQSHKTSASVEEIQKWGELFLITILVPYYLFGIIKNFAEARIHYGNSIFVPGVIMLSAISLWGMKKFVSSNKYSAESLAILAIGSVMLIAIIILSYIQVDIRSAAH